LTSLSVDVLGSVRVTLDGVEIPLASRRQRALVAALALRPGRPVSVSELVDAVWEDDPPDRARTTLQTYVSRLRRGLGPEAIEHGPAGYRLAPWVRTDVGIVREASGALARHDLTRPTERAAVALEALQGWEGATLGELADHAWFLGPAAELEEVRAGLVEDAAEALVSLGDASRAVTLLEANLPRTPLREPMRTLSVLALHAAGRSTEALRAADRYRRELRDETGLVPGPGFVEVERLVLSGEQPEIEPDGGAEASPETPDPGPAPVDLGTVVHRLPRPSTIIGRDAELAALAEIGSASRLVTVTGTGGIGKTRLVAEHVAARPGREQWLVVELAPVPPGAVAAAVGTALGYRAERADLTAVAELVRDQELVLVLDNCEHVLDEVRDLARAILVGAPKVQIVTTSRTRLDLPDEHLLRLDPLTLDGTRPDAAVLFVERVGRDHRAVDVAASDPAVIDLCRRLDGVPLALELAASRALALGVESLTDDLDAAMGLLLDAGPDQSRHASLGTVVDWSIALLPPEGRALLAALGTFRSDFDIHAAIAVGQEVVARPVPVVLGSLLEASLVTPSAAPGRFRLLEMVKLAALAELERGGDPDRAWRAHARWVARQVSALDEASVGAEEDEIAPRIDRLRHDVAGALTWALDHDEPDLAAPIVVPLAGPLLYRPDTELLAAVRQAGEDRAQRGPTDAALLAGAGRAAFLLGDLDDVERLARAALAAEHDRSTHLRAHHALGVLRLYQGAFTESEVEFSVGATDVDASLADRLDALSGLALALCYQGRLGAARAVLIRHRALADVVESETHRAFGEYIGAELHLRAGEVDEAASALTTSAERAWGCGATFVWGLASTVLASVLVRHRPVDDARRHLPLLIERWRTTATWPQLWTTLRLVAELLARTGEPGLALLVLLAADRDPSAPAAVGDDAVRWAELRRDLEARLGPEVSSGIEDAASVMERVAVLQRAVTALAL
jgi:predicted ATPase/DNA-binding SARP family transcriptional activator